MKYVFLSNILFTRSVKWSAPVRQANSLRATSTARCATCTRPTAPFTAPPSDTASSRSTYTRLAHLATRKCLRGSSSTNIAWLRSISGTCRISRRLFASRSPKVNIILYITHSAICPSVFSYPETRVQYCSNKFANDWETISFCSDSKILLKSLTTLISID